MTRLPSAEMAFHKLFSVLVLSIFVLPFGPHSGLRFANTQIFYLLSDEATFTCKHRYSYLRARDPRSVFRASNNMALTSI